MRLAHKEFVMIRLNDIVDRVLSYHPEADVSLIEKAYVYSAKVHAGQVRLSGEPYLMHPLGVAGILARMRLDVFSIASGLLHDTLEDTDTSLDDLKASFWYRSYSNSRWGDQDR